ncbi:MAG: hypothetical protein Q8N90_01455 [bacterium]|nr:hypothetical protein [bacterium]
MTLTNYRKRIRTSERSFISSHIIEDATEIKMDEIKGDTRFKGISDIRKIYIKNLKKYTDALNKEIADLLEIGSSTVTNVLNRRYKENDFIIKLSMEIDKNVKL